MRPSGGNAIVPHPTRGSRVSTTEEFEVGEDLEDEPEVDAEATPLDAEADADAEADYFAAQVDEAEERIDTEFSADSLQLFLKDVGRSIS